MGYPRWQKATVDKLKQCGAPLPLPAPRCAPHFASARAFSSFFLPLPSPPHRLSCRPRYFLFLSTVSRAVFSGTGDARPAEKGRLLTTGPTDDSHESMNETLQASLQRSTAAMTSNDCASIRQVENRVKIQKFHFISFLRSTYLDVYEIVRLFEREIILNLIVFCTSLSDNIN